MKKLALAAALTAAFAGSAFAQSSVTLYGRINTSAELQKLSGQDERYVLQNNASRWGLRGSEDLGGGLSAFFQLEAGFGSDNGAATAGFNRDSYVGLTSKTLGTIKAGRLVGELYYGSIDWIANMNHDTGVSSPDNLWLANGVFNVNAVQYLSPNFGGLVISGLVTAGEGNAALPKTYEIAATFDKGPVHLGGGYTESKNVADVTTNKSFVVSGAYTIGALTLGAHYENNDLITVGKRNHVYVSAQYNIGALELHTGANWADDFDNVANSGAKQYAFGVNYNLSKRTKIYSFFTKLDNESAASYAAVGGQGVGQDFRSLAAFGIRHNF